ncbi:MAG TPA: glucoamylase family protein [Rhizomicrobium sp.]|nr:glucoamylase family protein [Rhizomicrobium sp.]
MDISRLTRFPGRRTNPGKPEPAIRAELFSVERLEQHAESLARAQTVAPSRGTARLLAPRLRENSTVIEETYRKIVSATRAQQAITPAAEWLLDNFHVIDEQVREIKQDLPPGFYRRLPKLADGPLEGYPRVFGVAWAIVAHTDSAFDIEKLTRFVEAYQRVQPLTIGELWAIAITLRITLVENLRRLAEAIVERLSASRMADELADRILGTADHDPESSVLVPRSLALVQWSPAFAVQLSQRLRDRDPSTTPALRWLNERLAAEGTTTDQIVREEFQFQSAMNVTVRNVITSMRLVSMINWSEFVESVSPIDAILRGGSDFAAMDFPTRDLYRREIESLARTSGHDESDVAARVIASAKRAAMAAPARSARESDPGYLLIGDGRVAFERQLGCRIPFRTKLFRLNTALGVMSYVGMIAVVTAIVLAAALFGVAHAGAGDRVLIALGLAGLVPASDVAIAVVNRAITHLVGAAFLPGLELRDGVPPDMRTIVVVPTLLTAHPEVIGHIERLEVHYLSNADENLSFALLSDWGDSPSEHAAGDDALVAEAVRGIAELNARYPRAGGAPRFFLLHRRRVWNDGEQKWIGWERKRGKLHELDRLLRGASDTNFLPIDGRVPSPPTGIRYVITLDADTRMPIGVAKRLVGKMAHPLNRPRFDPRAGLVTEGHAVLQPRVTPSLPIGSEGSLFQRVFSGPNGLDPYAVVVSDVYQDLFEEGTYSGKGIYEVDAFEAAIAGKIPDSTVLSHDLLEGILARAGLVSDIEFVEEFPTKYNVAAARQHRWVRGDWQLLPWIFGRGRKAHSASPETAIPLMGRWKMLDNLRRSLSAPAALLSLLIAWLFLPLTAAGTWTVFIVLTIVLPPFLPVITAVLPRSPGIPLRTHLRNLGGDAVRGMLQSAFLLTFLAHQAWLMVDAMARTLFRLFVHRRRLLEWVTTSQTNDDSQFDPRSLIAQIAAGAAFAAVMAFAMAFTGHHAWPIAVPFAALWVLSPLAARWASLPPPESGHLAIAPNDATALRMIARRTWRFFEQFVTQEDNALPPDNFQEDPKPVIAHRTSPTNIGLYLLSVIAARDFGWLGTMDALERLETTLVTMQKLERYRGHLYNWYDTRDLRALEPRYVSSVDSGNLAGHLIALGNACREIASQPLVNAHWLPGLSDTLALFRESLPIAAKEPRAHRATSPELDAAVERLAELLREAPADAAETPHHLAKLEVEADALCQRARTIESANPGGNEPNVVVWAEALSACLRSHRRDNDLLMPRAEPGDDKSADTARSAKERLEKLADLATRLSTEMEFGFLFDPGRQLLSIGYRESDGSLDSNFYDLLASEARLASFIAIAKGDVPAKHWFRLGRTLTPIDSGSGLISWSGSMFEYLMPSLVMRAPSGSLLEQTNRLVVRRQEEYGAALHVPWGISESAYNARDMEHNYQYSSFGVPDLGYKRGLAESTVIAPYASGLAAMVDPAAVVRNFNRMAGHGARGAYGWYEALDYTRSRLPEGAKLAIVQAYMAHHQAMTIVGIANAVHDGAMRTRFHAEPIVQAAELLLQERVPREVAIARPPPEQTLEAAAIASLTPEVQRRYTSAHSRMPRSHILSNGRYSTMITAAGSGYSRWRDIALTRWREDVTCDSWGAYVFLRDVDSGEIFSAGYQPSVAEPDAYEVTFFEDRAEIIRRDSTLTTTLDVTVSPEDDAEVRRVSITNHGIRAREIEVTSYAEIALARQADDIAHPAFAKLFVETEFEPNLGAIVATRRRRSDGDPLVWAAHLAVVEGESSGDVQFETDRARFLGRGQTIRSPAAIVDGWPLTNTSGAVLDAIFSLRRRVRIPRGATARVAFWTVAASTREDVLDLADKHRDPMAFERATTLAWTQAQMQLRHLGIGTSEAYLFQRLANHVLYSDPTLRPSSAAIAGGMRKVSTLWPHGISGDLPIVLVRISGEEDLELVRQLLNAHEYWRLKQLPVDLVILNERAASYVQDLQAALDALVRMNQSMPKLAGEDARGSVFVLRADLISAEVRGLLHACARATLIGSAGTLAEQINRARDLKPAGAPPARRPSASAEPEIPPPRPEMNFWNGLGGFAQDGREYVTILEGNARTPAPWVNVVANPDFGFQVSTDGSGFTWSINSQQNQLTPWSNDPVGDAPGEAIYVRDEESGDMWGPTALPIREKNSYLSSHGQGYSRFEHDSHGISLELLQYVPAGDPIKISRLKIVNHSGRARRLSVTAYVEWVLGTNRSVAAPFVVTEGDPETRAIFARNPWSDEFGERVAFADLNGRQTSWTADRTEFIGRDGALDRPLALSGAAPLSGRAGAGLDPCAALQTLVTLAAVGTTEIVFFLGETATKVEAQALIAKYRKADLDAVLTEITGQWDSILGVVQVKTPDRALDILLNRWLLYQTLACRVWARAGFYQASGAYGFRDQLQDVMALCVSRPDLARAHLLRAAARQFVEGDVQHWWLAESGRGIRTRISDDRCWLAHAVAHYVNVTGDRAVLDENVPFLEAPVLHEGERDRFFQPAVSGKQASLFEHCALALDKSLATGAHSLPLMGTGDWNDGMDRVGEGGKGESVWLAWFLFSTLTAFARLADAHNNAERAAEWRQFADTLRDSIERQAWDGDWYRRAYFDDGTPLGSIANNECRIDAIAQSWAVISRAGQPARAARAMAALDKYLVRREEQLLLLLAPPFDNPAHDPGYIKGYPPGIRENGGQYTHAALWSAMAWAMQGDGDRIGEILSMLNPVNHAGDQPGVHRYRVEPYVVCADIYAMPPHVGRGGWTWYTGSAAWMYRVGLERLLGFRLNGGNLTLDPCIPRNWPGFEISFRYRSSRYAIVVENPLGVCRGILATKIDGEVITGNRNLPISMKDDNADHRIQIILG